ncbi:MAG: arginase family protein [Acidiferrobacterales bacterium]
MSDTTAFLAERGIKPAIIGGDNSISYPVVRGICQGMPGKKIALVHFDAHRGAMSSGVPYRLLLERHGDQVHGRHMTQIGISDFCNNPGHHADARDHGIEVISTRGQKASWSDTMVPLADISRSRSSACIHQSWLTGSLC